jgi:hypothetical protein
MGEAVPTPRTVRLQRFASQRVAEPTAIDARVALSSFSDSSPSRVHSRRITFAHVPLDI